MALASTSTLSVSLPTPSKLWTDYPSILLARHPKDAVDPARPLLQQYANTALNSYC